MNFSNPSGTAIPPKTSVKDLGVYFSHNGNFNHHIATVAANGRKLTGWILRTFVTRERGAMVTLLKSLIIPRMEYCCSLWSPSNQHNISLLEDIQRSFTKRILGCSNLTYWDRLKSLNLLSLERRRERYTIIYLWKCLHGYSDDPGLVITSIDRAEGIRLALPKLPRTSAGWANKLKENSVLYRGVKIFNCLPSRQRKLGPCQNQQHYTPDSFKAKLDKYLSNIPDEPTIPEQQRRAATNSVYISHNILLKLLDKIMIKRVTESDRERLILASRTRSHEIQYINSTPNGVREQTIRRIRSTPAAGSVFNQICRTMSLAKATLIYKRNQPKQYLRAELI